MTKIEYLYAYGSLAIFAGILSLLGFWWLYPYNVLEAREGNFSLSKQVYEQGEILDVQLILCKNMEVSEHVLGRFIDGIIYTIPDKVSDLEGGCYKTTLVSVKIPDNLPSGKYIYTEEVVYQVNPIRQVKYHFETPEFEVVESE